MDLKSMDNATLMKTVQELRGVLWEAKSLREVFPQTWGVIHKMREAEALMRTRNLPLDHPALGKRFTNAEIADYLVLQGEGDSGDGEEESD
jgi:hypothetical protein